MWSRWVPTNPGHDAYSAGPLSGIGTPECAKIGFGHGETTAIRKHANKWSKSTIKGAMLYADIAWDLAWISIDLRASFTYVFTQLHMPLGEHDLNAMIRNRTAVFILGALWTWSFTLE